MGLITGKTIGVMDSRIAALAAVVLMLMMAGAPAGKATVNFPGSNVSVSADIADSPLLRERGLMFVPSLPKDGGMLFIFDSTQELSFWMKNTLISLDIIFVSENYTVVNIAENAQPCSGYCPLYLSAAPAKYAVEVNAGFARKNGINIGDNVAFG